jgi:D-arginine dehydrogenase
VIEADVAVIGAGIAGVGAAYELSASASVVLLEQEREPAYHTTGRSAAMFLTSYGGERVGPLTAASRPVFDRIGTLLRPRPWLVLRDPAGPDGGHEAADGDSLEPLTPAEALALCPVLRPEWTEGAMLERSAQEIDVLGLHQHFLGGARRRGARVHLSTEVLAGHRDRGSWLLDTTAGAVRVAAVVDAAGAWADVIATRLGIEPIGLTPLVRTAAVARYSAADQNWPLVGDLAETFYFRPEGQGLLISPADETPAGPHDARAEELAVALALERVNAATTLDLRSVSTAWAGLRTFTPDRDPVVGSDPAEPSFCWLAGQGGFGIQTAPELSRLAASAVLGGAGAVPEALSVARFRNASGGSPPGKGEHG